MPTGVTSCLGKCSGFCYDTVELGGEGEFLNGFANVVFGPGSHRMTW